MLEVVFFAIVECLHRVILLVRAKIIYCFLYCAKMLSGALLFQIGKQHDVTVF